MGIFMSFHIRVRLTLPTSVRLWSNIRNQSRLFAIAAHTQAEMPDTWIWKFTKMRTCNLSAFKRKTPDFILSGKPANAGKVSLRRF